MLSSRAPERRVSSEQTERKMQPVSSHAFSPCEFPLKFKFVGQNLGSESGDLVIVFGPLMGKLFNFCANVSSSVKDI